MCFYFCTFRFLAPWPAGRCRMFWNPQSQLVLGRYVGASDFLFLSSSAGLPGARAPRGVREGLPVSVGRRHEGKVPVTGNGCARARGRETCFLPLSTVLGEYMQHIHPTPGARRPRIQRGRTRTLHFLVPFATARTPGKAVITGWLSKQEGVLNDLPKLTRLENSPESERRRETQGPMLLPSLLNKWVTVCV